MEGGPANRDVRAIAMIALTVFALFEIVTFAIFRFEQSVPALREIPTIPAAVLIFSWVIPLSIVCRVERKDAQALGLTLRRNQFMPHILCAVFFLALPIAFVGVDIELILEFVDQVIWIGLPEEVFNRGYLMNRLCNWLGNRKGLVLSAALFGLSHILSRIGQHGFDYPVAAMAAGAQSLVGWLVLGLLFLKTRSIVLPAIVHISMNAYLSRIL